MNEAVPTLVDSRPNKKAVCLAGSGERAPVRELEGAGSDPRRNPTGALLNRRKSSNKVD